MELILFMINNYNKLQDKGFTLIEILVAVGIFSVVISIAVGIFIGSSGSQRKILELYDTQREGNYLMETVSRELRMAIAISDGTDGHVNQQNNDDSSVEFKNYDGDWIIYCRANNAGACTNNDTGDYFARDGEKINSSNVKIEYLRFYVSRDFNNVQPMVTVVMKVKSTGSQGTEFILQNSVAMRLY